MSHFFISYAKKDTRELALKLSDMLNAVSGVTAWVDRSLKAGKSWELQIESEIDRCDYMVVLCSPDLNRHKNGQPQSYMLKEIAYAQAEGKTIIPVMAQATKLPLSLIDLQYINFMLPGVSVDDLLRSICNEANIAPVKFDARGSESTKKATNESDTTEKFQSGISAPWTPGKPARSKVYDILPHPFEWIDVPVGKVSLTEGGYVPEGGQIFEVPAFTIAKYPVTNTQFTKFVEAGGYKQRRWWTDAGWDTREKKKWLEPGYWSDAQWNGADTPVVGVSWYESLAYCAWLSEISEKKILLPTEQQWQRAAQGDDEQIYPWGNYFDSGRCNTRESGITQTTPVTQYPQGTSPFGVMDMSGNVWEWCLTNYVSDNQPFENDNFKVLKGGSFFNLMEVATCAYRYRKYPHYRSHAFGFRLVLSEILISI